MSNRDTPERKQSLENVPTSFAFAVTERRRIKQRSGEAEETTPDHLTSILNNRPHYRFSHRGRNDLTLKSQRLLPL